MNLLLFLALDFAVMMALSMLGLLLFFMIGTITFYTRYFKKAPQGQALVRTGNGGIQVSLDKGMLVIPGLHLCEQMDISVKKLAIHHLGKDGLFCKDKLRADVKVAFFIRVNNSTEDIIKIAQTIGCERASSEKTLTNLFEAKFSEALKMVSKQFDFVDLFQSQDKFKAEILHEIGRDLNGYTLDDCAIGYLEQTPLQHLNENNILDAEGIKKITELTAAEKIKANLIKRKEERDIRKQDVAAREDLLELERQLMEKKAMHEKEIAKLQSRETAGEAKYLKLDATEEEIQIAEVKAEFLMRPNNTSDNTARIALHIACKDALDSTALNRLFLDKFTAAIQTIGRTYTVDDLLSDRNLFKTKIRNHIGMDLDAFMLCDLTISDINE